MELSQVWTPISATIASLIATEYNATTDDVLNSSDATKIERMCFNYCHALMHCNMLFDEETTLAELQTLLKEAFVHKSYALVTEWKMICSALKLDSGKQIHQESFYDVADTPRIESKDWNELNVKARQARVLYENSQAIKELYNEIKMLVQTIY